MHGHHAPDRPHPTLRSALFSPDLRAAAQLASQATQGVINITEGVHPSVRRRLGLSSGASGELDHRVQALFAFGAESGLSPG